MNRNSSSHFSASDNRINIGRSKFNRNSWTKTTMNFGDLVPFYVDEILPGDTFDMNTSVLARLSTPKFPTMDNAYLDTYFFFVPARLVWEHWKEFNGENNVNAWTNTSEYLVPAFDYSLFAYEGGEGVPNPYNFSTADYMGVPIDNGNLGGVGSINYINALPFRSYHLIWNEFFRDQNLQDPILINTGDSVSGAEFLDLMQLRKVCKFHDYFTSALPAPQKGPSVLIPGLEDVPVVTGDLSHGGPYYGLRWRQIDGDFVGMATNNEGDLTLSLPASSAGSNAVFPTNLYTGEALGATIDSLRTAFQIQKLLWRDGNGGTRYTEILRSHFGVVSPDARLQRPEYLGGKRIPLTMTQVVQQSATPNSEEDAVQTYLGSTGAYSKTTDAFHGFTKSFTEHGYLIGVCCARTDHTYQQGINRMWSRRSRFDFYYPELANIGEQPILNREIYLQESAADDEVFGYQEAWAEYRYRPSYVTGAFRDTYHNSLGFATYADRYTEQPILSADWITEGLENVNKTLIVPGSETDKNQLLLDFYFQLTCTRPMPVYSVPGLVDHF